MATSAGATRLRALVIEDDARSATATRMVLQGHGMDVEISDALAPALEAAESLRPDAIILDLGLPETDGVDTIEVVRARAPDAAIIVLTGSQDSDLAAAAFGLGSQELLIKGSFEWSSVPALVEHAVARHTRVRAVERATHTSRFSRPEHPEGFAISGETAKRGLGPGDVKRYAVAMGDAILASRLAGRTQTTPASLARELGARSASPGDVLDIYAFALRELPLGAGWDEQERLSQEGLIVLVELLSELAGIYRREAKAIGRQREPRAGAHHYTVYASAENRTTADQLDALLARELDTAYEIEVVDVDRAPGLAQDALILRTPTIVRDAPRPELRLVGEIESLSKARLGLGLALHGDEAAY